MLEHLHPISTKKGKAGVVCPLIDIRVRTITYRYALKIKEASSSLTGHACTGK